MIDLKNYVCSLPFTNVELHKGSSFMCCPSWLTKRLPNNAKLNTIWNSEEAIDIRKSIIDGSYKYCDKTMCPYLSELINVSDKGDIGPIIPKAANPQFLQTYDYASGMMGNNPEYVQFSFDKTCNFKCPSCRVGLIVANTKEIKEVELTIKEIEETFANDVKTLYITGTGDPFVSVGFRNFLRGFNPIKYPKLQSIHLHTNASMWTKEMWDSMPNIHPYVKTCEISIDAGTKDTYENYTRIGGDWNTLIDNLNFINTIPKLTYIKTSFVVQSHNYNEMGIFVNLMKSIFDKKVHIYFGKILNWGHLSDTEYKLLKVWDVSHPEYSNFIYEFNKISKNYQVFHNMQEFMDLSKSLM
jgi:MoaA/NifB/PqqE/SkfB family radical SAM enzyme